MKEIIIYVAFIILVLKEENHGSVNAQINIGKVQVHSSRISCFSLLAHFKEKRVGAGWVL